MPPRKPQASTSLRDELERIIANRLAIAERLDRLGGTTRHTDEPRARLAALERGDEVEVASWELASALDALNAPRNETSAVLRGADSYTVETDGTYQSAPLTRRQPPS